MRGPHQQRLITAVQEAAPARLDDASAEWRRGHSLLASLAEQLEQKAAALAERDLFTGRTADAAAGTFSRSAHRMRERARQMEDGGWEPDPLLLDERWVAANVKDKGLIVFTACSHAGVVNVLKHAQDCFPGVPLHAVVGGFHLSGGNEKIIPETVEGLKAFDLKTIAAAHCTGWRAVSAMASVFGDALAPAAVGKTYRF